MLIISTVVILPVLLILLYKSERIQAKFAYQLGLFKKDLVSADFDSANPENNFKLISGVGIVKSTEPIVDELFQLKIYNAIRIKRTVEICDFKFDRKRNLKGAGSCENLCNSDSDGAKDYGKLEWMPVNNYNQCLVHFRSEIIEVDEAYIGVHKLSERQIRTTGGEYECLDMTDDLALQLIGEIRDNPVFADFESIIRSGKYLVCRVPREHSGDESEGRISRIFGANSWEYSHKTTFYRNQFKRGDVRIKFEYVKQPEVSVLAQ